jgi:hypothetical protein
MTINRGTIVDGIDKLTLLNGLTWHSDLENGDESDES